MKKKWLALLLLPLLLGAHQTVFAPFGTSGFNNSPYNPCLTGGWPMNEGSGSTNFDVLGHNNLTLHGTYSWQSNTGLPGTTVLFNGTGYAEAANFTYTNFTGTSPYTVIFWVSGGSDKGIQQQMVGPATFASPFKGWSIFQNINTGLNPSDPVFDLINTISSNGIQVVGDTVTNIGDGGLHQVAFTYDGSQTAAGVNAYVDGGGPLSTTVNQNNLSSSTATNSVMYVGSDAGNTNPYFGAEAFLAIYNCVLTTGTISGYYGAGPQIN